MICICLTGVILILSVFAVVFVIRSQIFIERNTIVTTSNLYAVDVLLILCCSLHFTSIGIFSLPESIRYLWAWATVSSFVCVLIYLPILLYTFKCIYKVYIRFLKCNRFYNKLWLLLRIKKTLNRLKFQMILCNNESIRTKRYLVKSMSPDFFYSVK